MLSLKKPRVCRESRLSAGSWLAWSASAVRPVKVEDLLAKKMDGGADQAADRIADHMELEPGSQGGDLEVELLAHLQPGRRFGRIAVAADIENELVVAGFGADQPLHQLALRKGETLLLLTRLKGGNLLDTWDG